MNVVVSGATGLVGRALVAALGARGDRVQALSRDGARAEKALGVPSLTWNAESAPPPAAALVDADAVVHLAGENLAEGRWTDERKRRFRSSRVDTTRHLVAGLAAAPPRARTLVSASAVGYYGSRDALLDETAPPGDDYLARLCRDWEAEAERARDLGVRVVTVRTGIVLATGGGAFAKLRPLVKAGVAGKVGDGKQGFPWIHLADEVGLLLHALDTRAVDGPLNAVAPETVDNAQFMRAMGRALHRPTVLPVPAFALRLATGEMADMLLGGQKLRPAVAERTGYRFRFAALDAALADLAAA